VGKVLVISTVEHSEDLLRSHVGQAEELKAVVPVVRQGVLIGSQTMRRRSAVLRVSPKTSRPGYLALRSKRELVKQMSISRFAMH
jgi:hypothetical protein